MSSERQVVLNEIKYLLDRARNGDECRHSPVALARAAETIATSEYTSPEETTALTEWVSQVDSLIESLMGDQVETQSVTETLEAIELRLTTEVKQ